MRYSSQACPALGAGTDDQARRFVNLVDEFYDRNVKLVLAAAMPLLELYQWWSSLDFEFQRTVSRLAGDAVASSIWDVSTNPDCAVFG